MVVFMGSAFSQRMYDSSGRQIGRVDGLAIYDASGGQVDRINGDHVYNSSNKY